MPPLLSLMLPLPVLVLYVVDSCAKTWHVAFTPWHSCITFWTAACFGYIASMQSAMLYCTCTLLSEFQKLLTSSGQKLVIGFDSLRGCKKGRISTLACLWECRQLRV